VACNVNERVRNWGIENLEETVHNTDNVKKQRQNLEYFNYLGRIITNYAR
jgi:hypothetical protein